MASWRLKNTVYDVEREINFYFSSHRKWISFDLILLIINKTARCWTGKGTFNSCLQNKTDPVWPTPQITKLLVNSLDEWRKSGENCLYNDWHCLFYFGVFLIKSFNYNRKVEWPRLIFSSEDCTRYLIWILSIFF